MSISKRILILVCLPILAMAGLAAWILAEKWQVSAKMQRLVTGGAVIERLSDLVSSAQVERGRSALFLGSGGKQFGQELTVQRQSSDARRKAFDAVTEPDLIKPL